MTLLLGVARISLGFLGLFVPQSTVGNLREHHREIQECYIYIISCETENVKFNKKINISAVAYMIILKIFFSRLQNRQFNFSPRKHYDLVAERSEATSKNLQFSDWLRGQDSNL